MSKLVQAGGTAKTTMAALGVLLSRRGIPVHLVDMDSQASPSRAFGQTDPAARLYYSFASRASLPVDTLAPNLTLSPSSIELARMETELLTEPGREYFLRTCLERTQRPANAAVLLDCPPSLGILAVNCLAMAGGLLTVVQPGGFELHALVHLQVTVRIIQERVQPDLCVLGAIITNAHRRRVITNQVAFEVSRVSPVLGVVRADARLLYATTAGRILALTRSKALDDYAAVVTRLKDGIL